MYQNEHGTLAPLLWTRYSTAELERHSHLQGTMHPTHVSLRFATENPSSEPEGNVYTVHPPPVATAPTRTCEGSC